ncbi:hypothetical protein [Planosporangium mesophilum]|uniref:hypothetical protein n=1 Tax=Planosporangium mesophilum TaxID=689768 RepID=UPI00143B0233|nr:hypothetical protein [Planosporangium mesophilum]NJC86140.1 hypothetical protein [Planosporangium mesophilum]
MTAPATLAAPAGFVPALAIALWLGLLAVAAVVLLATGSLAWWQRRRDGSIPALPVTRLRGGRPRREDLVRLVAEVEALNVHAVSAGIAAADAESAAVRARARCRAAEWRRERAWNEYDTAQREYVAALRAGADDEEVWPAASTSGAWPVLVAGGAEPAGQPPTGPSPSPEEQPAVEQPPVGQPPVEPEPELRDEVARAALAAYRRGGISVEQLRAVLRHTDGWTHVHARHEREVLLRRAAERAAHRRYTAAALAERSAYQAVDVADAAARAWADEAMDAAEDARLARAYLAHCLRTAGVRRRLARAYGAPGARRRLPRQRRREAARAAAAPADPTVAPADAAPVMTGDSGVVTGDAAA